MIAIIDYGVGNIRAFINIYNRLGIRVKIAQKKEDLSECSKLILPGVGAFDYAITMLNKSGMREDLDELVLEKKTPIIGICVGMQMLAESSDEGILPGLGWIRGNVKKFDIAKMNLETHLPHMGWNDVTVTCTSPLFKNLESDAKFYFLHSYYFSCRDALNAIAQTEYGISFTSAVNSTNIYGVQFHPEKSHRFGIQLLKNFADL